MTYYIPRPPRAVRSTFSRYWYTPEAAPILLLTGGALLGAGWFTWRSAHSPNVVWDHHNNPHPYLKIEPGTNTKFMAVNVRTLLVVFLVSAPCVCVTCTGSAAPVEI